MRHLYIDGDSTAYGMHDKESGGWPHRLHMAYLNQETRLEDTTFVQSRAYPGRTLAGILRSVNTTLRDFRRMGTVTAIVQTGMNEVKIFPSSDNPVVPRELFGRQILQFCDIVRENDCSALLVGPPPIDPTLDNPTFSGALIQDKMLAKYSETMRDVAESRDWPIAYVDTRAAFANSGRPVSELLSEDGYHPNTPGHAVMFEAVSAALSGLANR